LIITGGFAISTLRPPTLRYTSHGNVEMRSARSRIAAHIAEARIA
jgi:hypothetical protein